MAYQKITLLDPVAPAKKEGKRLSARLNTLAGKSVGIYDSLLWANFGRFADHLEELLKTKIGVARVVRLSGGAPGSGKRPGKKDLRVSDAEMDAFAQQIDTAIVGLGA